MGLSVKERGEFIATFRYIQVKLMETLAEWVPTTPEMEVKLLFGAHIWDMAQQADALGKRTHELRMPLQHSLRPSDAYVEVLTELSTAKETAQRIAGFYDVMLPALAARYRQYLDRTDALMDTPTVRILERMIEDRSRMIRESQELRSQLPKTQLRDRSWAERMANMESAVKDFVLQRRQEPISKEVP